MKQPVATLVLLFISVSLQLFATPSSAQVRWEPMLSYPWSVVSSAAVCSDNELVAVTSSSDKAPALFSTRDSGRTWHFRTTVPLAYRITHLIALGDSLLVASFEPSDRAPFPDPSTRFGLWRSTDKGGHWALAHTSSGSKTLDILSTAERIVAYTADSLFLSTDAGTTWSAMLAPVPIRPDCMTATRDGYFIICDVTSLQSTRNFIRWTSLRVPQPTASLIPFGGTGVAVTMASGDFYTTSDRGQTWDTLPSNHGERLVAQSRTGTLYSAGTSTVHRLTPASTNWTSITLDGYSLGNPLRFVEDSIGRYFIVTGSRLNRLTASTSIANSCGPINVEASTVTAGSPHGVVFQTKNEESLFTSNGGRSWMPLIPTAGGHSRTLWCSYRNSLGYVTLNEYRDGDNKGSEQWYSLLHSTDGVSWSETSHVPGEGVAHILGLDRAGRFYVLRGNEIISTPDLGLTFSRTVTTLDSLRSYDGMLSLPDRSLVLGDTAGVQVSTDNGAHWLYNATAEFRGRPRSLACDSSGRMMAIVDGEGIFTSPNDGVTWNRHDNGLHTTAGLNAIAYAGENKWLCATERGVFMRSGDTSQWEAINEGIEDSNIVAIDVAGPNDFYAGTWNAGVYHTIDQQHSTVTRYEVSQPPAPVVWPNPSARSITISLPEPGLSYQEIALFSISGERIRTICSTDLGSQIVRVDHADLPSGRYLLRLISPLGVTTIPLIFDR